MSSLSKRILTAQDLELFGQSSLHQDLVAFIESLSDSCRGKSLKSKMERSQTIDRLVEVLESISRIVDEVPAIETASRFGNAAFPVFYDRVKEVSRE